MLVCAALTAGQRLDNFITSGNLFLALVEAGKSNTKCWYLMRAVLASPVTPDGVALRADSISPRPC